MPDLLVRNLDEDTVARLKARAAAAGRSLQSELKTILEQQVSPDRDALLLRLDEIRDSYRGRDLTDSADLIRELRDER